MRLTSSLKTAAGAVAFFSPNAGKHGTISASAGKTKLSMRKLLWLAAFLFSLAAGLGTAQAAPELAVTITPSGEVRRLSQITAQFSEDMRPLGQTQDAAPPLALISGKAPLPPGVFRWLDTATLAYLFEEPVNAPVHIAASIPAGVQSLSGHALPAPIRQEISTPPLTLSLSGHDSLPPENAAFTLHSNYPLNPNTLARLARLTLSGHPLPIEITASNPAIPGGRIPENSDYAIRILQKLPPDQTLVFTLADGLTAEKGGEPQPGRTFTLSTWQALALQPRPGQKTGHPIQPENPLPLCFNNPVSRNELLAHLALSPQAPRLDETPVQQAARPSRCHILPFEWAARTRYHVTVHPGLKDIFGSTLEKAASFSFVTSDFAPLYIMPAGDRILDPALKGRFPLRLRNPGPITLTIRHFGWTPETWRAWQSGPIEDNAFNTLVPLAEKTLTPDFSSRPNQNIRYDLDLPALLGYTGTNAMPPGLTVIRLTWLDPENRDREGYPFSHTLFASVQITRLALHARMGDRESLAWATDLETGRPLSGIALALADENGLPAWQGITDSNGLAVLPGRLAFSRPLPYLVARQENHNSILPLRLGSPILPQAKNEHWAIHAITPLPLYQPGQTVPYLLYLKTTDEDASGWRPLAGEKVTVTVLDVRNRTIHTQEAQTGDYGSISGKLALPDEAALGPCRFHVTRTASGSAAGAPGFQVAAFRAPDFILNLKPPAGQPAPPSKAAFLPVTVSAAYATGLPLPDAPVEMTVTRQNTFFFPARLADYQTGVAPNRPFPLSVKRSYPFWRSPETLGTFRKTTDTGGYAGFTLPRISVLPGQPVKIGMTVTVTDPAGLTTQSSATTLFHPCAYYIGIRLPHRFLPGKSETIRLKAATWDNHPLANLPVTLSAEQIQEYDAETGEPKTKRLWQKTLRLGSSESTALPIRFEKSGAYRLVAVIRDKSNRENRTIVPLFVSASGSTPFIAPDNRELEILGEDNTYRPGQTARLFIRNPFHHPENPQDSASLALVTLERNSVKSRRLMEIKGETVPLDIQLSKNDAPYIYVSVALVKGRTASPAAARAASENDTDAPQIRYASRLIRVSQEKTGLRVHLDTGASQRRPGDTVCARVQVTDTDNRPRQAQITLLAVDSRILRAAGENARYNPADTFQPVYSHPIFVEDTRNNLTGSDSLSPPRFSYAEKTAVMASGIAADSANGSGSGNAITLRENFTPVAHWLAEGHTRANGQMQTCFALPDTLTAYRIVAIAADKENTFATDETAVTASRPLQLLSALPRFATEGDRLEARILVQNTSRQQQAVTLTAGGHNLQLENAVSRLKLNSGESIAVDFPAKIGRAGEASLTVTGRMGREKDAAVFRFPVMPAVPLTTVAAAGTLKAGETRNLPVAPPSPPDPASRLEVTFAASPAAGLPPAARQLIASPWDCLEQRMSRVWARAIRIKQGRLIGLEPESGDARAICEDLKAAAKYQKHNGGFALWPGLLRPSLYLTAYVLMVNHHIRPLGFALPEDVMQQAVGYLRERLQENRDGKAALPPDAEALALLQLARHDKTAALALYPALLERAAKDPNAGPMTWGSLLMATPLLADGPGRQEQASRIRRQLEKNAQITPAHLHFSGGQHTAWQTLGSSLRDNGMLLGALTGTQPDYPRLEALAAWVAQGLGNRPDPSTQETIYSLWGLSAYLEQLGGEQPTSLTAVWNQRDTMTKRFARLTDPPQTWVIPASRLDSNKQAGLSLTAGEGNPYWNARLTYPSPAASLREENAGLTLRRTWERAGSPPGRQAAWKMGDIINVTLTLTVPATRRHVLLFDPFPAGLEPLYATRNDLARQTPRQPPWQWEETRNDGLLLYSETLSPGVYTYTYRLRAAAPGIFVQRPSQAVEMYTPEVFGRTAGSTVVIKK